MGPRKPQRSSSTSEQSANYHSATSIPNCFLETSFTSLQSPSSNSSITNGYYSTRSQPSPVSFNRITKSSTTVICNNLDRSASALQGPCSVHPTKLQPSRPEPKTISRSLSLSLRSCNSPKVDLIHDDWLGLAPLASPESLSELSSISSRTSLVTTTNVIVEINRTPKIMRRTPKIIGSLSTCADDIRNIRNFQKAKTFTRLLVNNNIESSSSSNISYESASSGNRCCQDTSTRDNSCMDLHCGGQDYDPSDSEFQSAEDILDNVLASAGCKEFFNSESNILETNFDFLPDQPQSLTIGYFGNSPVFSTVTSPCSQQEIDQDLISNLAIDLNLDEEHRAIRIQKAPSQISSSVDSGSVCRTPSDITKNVTFNPEVITVDAAACESRSSPPKWRQLFKSRSAKQKPEGVTAPAPASVNPSAAPIKTILSMKRRSNEEVEGLAPAPNRTMSSRKRSSDDEDNSCFSRTEQLPLLAGLSGGVGERTPSPCYVRRKKYVYPADVVVMSQQPNESAV